MKDSSCPLLFTVDLAGTFLFALEGAMTAIQGGLDFFGVMVLSFATALGGGVIRDLLIGDVPPASLRDWRYSGVTFSAGATVFLFHHFVQEVPASLIVGLDAAGLSLFAIAGTEKALTHGMHPFIAALMGTITGVGGGTVRDIFLAHVPTVLRSDVYATAALAGSIIMIVALKSRIAPTVAAALGGSACFLLRMVSVWQHWNLPKVTAP